MTEHADFLFELGTEELPAGELDNLASYLTNYIEAGLKNKNLLFGEVSYFSTPRRLAVLIKNLVKQQSSQNIERKGPPLQAAFDKAGNPTPAAEGFAKSCGVSVKDLLQEETEQGKRLIYRGVQVGQSTITLLPAIVEGAIAALPIKKRMRWGDFSTEFVRPVHWVVMLFGKEVVDCSILGIKVGRKTRGHRFHHPGLLTIKKPEDFEELLENEGYVLADWSKRLAHIERNCVKLASEIGGIVDLEPDSLLEEVTGIVEWPVVLKASFDERFLSLPKEVLTIAMKHHQRCFPVLDKQKKLLPCFIAVSNIESKQPEMVIQGNERVMRARLSDAEFFYHTDLKHSLHSRVEQLKNIVFQEKLGSLYDKAKRLEKLTAKLVIDLKEIAGKAGLLAKTDLVTEMVGEFPELQGVMGYYYAKNAGESEEIALAIREHYFPRFAGDELPSTHLGCALALADRLDTLVGIFGINQVPRGDKDPFGLRRSALGIIRIVLETDEFRDKFHFDKWFKYALENYEGNLANSNVEIALKEFILDRLYAWYQDRDISADKLSAVLAANNENLGDIHARVLALNEFSKRSEATDLIAANKRVANILRKEKVEINAQSFSFEDIRQLFEKISKLLLREPAEEELYKLIKSLLNNVLIKEEENKTKDKKEYSELLDTLAQLHLPLNNFFDKVLVNADDNDLKNNRLALLNSLRKLFLKVADISLLSGALEQGNQ